MFSDKMIELAKRYKVVEEELRRAAERGVMLSVRDLMDISEVAELCEKESYLRTTLEMFKRHGHLAIRLRESNTWPGKICNEYMWDVTSPPFILGKMKERAAQVTAGKPTSLEVPILPSKGLTATSGALELMLGAVTLVIDVNPATGRARIIIGG